MLRCHANQQINFQIAGLESDSCMQQLHLPLPLSLLYLYCRISRLGNGIILVEKNDIDFLVYWHCSLPLTELILHMFV